MPLEQCTRRRQSSGTERGWLCGRRPSEDASDCASASTISMPSRHSVRIGLRLAQAITLLMPLLSPVAALTAVLRPLVLSTNGDEIEVERYVGVVRERSPWNEPVAEALIPAGDAPPAWELPPGTYRIACSALGFWWEHKSTVDLAPGEERIAECRLRPMVPRLGRIYSGETGKPVQGAKVGHLHGFLERFSLQLSPLGEDHSVPQRTAQSEVDGVFRVFGPVGFKFPLWVEAEGYAPHLLRNIQFSEDPAEPIEISLSRGASLTASVRLPDLSESSGYVLTLVAEGGERGGSLPAEAMAMTDLLWERTVSASQEVSWSSLPAGRYRIWLRPIGSGLDEALPMRAATVELASGDSRAIDIDAGEWQKANVKSAPTDSDLAVLVRADTRIRGKFRVIRASAGEVESFTAAVEPVSAGLRFTSPGSCRKGSTYVLVGDDSVSLPVSVSDVGRCSDLETDLRPSRRVKGRIRVPHGKAVPARVEIGFAPCTQEKSHQLHERLLFPAKVSEDGAWLCPRAEGLCLADDHDRRIRAGLL